jgi:sugar phosphate permease
MLGDAPVGFGPPGAGKSCYHLIYGAFWTIHCAERPMLRPKKLHYGWIVVGVTFITLLFGAGVRSAPGVLLVPLENEFHWSRATISFAIAVNLLLYGLIGPFAAAMMDRFGFRRLMLTALALIGIGVALTSFMHESWQLIVLWGLLVGAGTGIIANVLAAMVASRWFTVQRGLVIGVLTSSAAAGQLIFLPTLAAIAEAYGWRPVVLTLAAVALIVFPVVAILMRDRPEDVGLAPYGDKGGPKSPVIRAGNPFGIAFEGLAFGLHKRDFWLLAGSFFVCGASTNGLIGTHLIPACLDNGITEFTGASLLAAMGVFNFLGTTGSGWLSDRVDNRILLAVYYGLRGLSLMYLPFSFVSFYGLSLFAVFYGLDWIATVPPTVRLAANAFGTEKIGIIYGWIFASHQLGSATAAFLAGVLRMDLGTYLQAFILSGLLCIGAAVMVMFIGVDWESRQPVARRAFAPPLDPGITPPSTAVR